MCEGEEGLRMTWGHVVERDTREHGLKREDTQGREKWMKLLGEHVRKTIAIVVLN